MSVPPRARFALAAAAALALTACTSQTGGGHAAPTTRVHSAVPTASGTPAKATLEAAILSDAAVSAEHLTSGTPPTPLVDAENAPRALLRACGSTQQLDKAIDDAWQQTWLGDPDGAVLRASEVAVHLHGTTGAAEIEAVRHRLSCGYYLSVDRTEYTISEQVRSVPVTGTDDQFAFCGRTEGFNGTDCTLLLSSGAVAAALTVSGLTDDAARQAIERARRALGNAVVAAAIGRPIVTSSPPRSPSTTQLAPPGATWTVAQARQHFLSMVPLVGTEFGPDRIAKDLGEPWPTPADLLQDATYHADDYASRLKIFTDNLAAGNWPAGAAKQISALAASARSERSAFTATSKAGSVDQLRTRFTAAQAAADAMAGKLDAARHALGIS